MIGSRGIFEQLGFGACEEPTFKSWLDDRLELLRYSLDPARPPMYRLRKALLSEWLDVVPVCMLLHRFRANHILEASEGLAWDEPLTREDKTERRYVCSGGDPCCLQLLVGVSELLKRTALSRVDAFFCFRSSHDMPWQ